MKGDRLELTVLVGLGVFSLVQMLLSPIKLYNLIVHKKGWHDD